jgi:hypothetical protein
LVLADYPSKASRVGGFSIVKYSKISMLGSAKMLNAEVPFFRNSSTDLSQDRITTIIIHD